MTNETDPKVEKERHRSNRCLGPLRNLSLLATTLAWTLAFLDYLPWQIANDDRLNPVSVEDRLILTIQLSFIDLLPLIVALFAVINVRISTIPVNPPDPRADPLVQKPQRILQNTLEQLIIKWNLSFTLCTVLQPNQLIILPMFTVVFIVGRLKFALGYPNYRSFGMGTNIFSAPIVIFFLLYRLFVDATLVRLIKLKLSPMINVLLRALEVRKQHFGFFLLQC